MKTDRASYLAKYWRPYESVTGILLDCLDYVCLPPKERAAEHRVGGRLGRNSNSWQLQSNGQVIDFEFDPAARLSDSFDTNEISFHSDLLAEGDLVSVTLVARVGQVFATEVKLLVPSQASGFELPMNHETGLAWSRFLDCVRGFFKERGYVEVQTPTLVPSPGTEPYLDPFTTRWEFGRERHEFYLPTSPEFHLKKMLAAGWTKIFEIKTCFRNGEVGEIHQPEFNMLEWYRAYSGLDAIIDDIVGLMRSVWSLSAAHRGGIPCPTVNVTTIRGLFLKYLGFELTPQTSGSELRALCESKGRSTSADDDWDDLFFRLFLEYIEPMLQHEGPIIVRDYPPSQAALSRLNSDGWADRFEFYWKGLEIANAFNELNDPQENRARFKRDCLKKESLGKNPVPMDEDLLRALDHGIPPTGGIALGLDRLFMAVTDMREISRTRPFPFTYRLY